MNTKKYLMTVILYFFLVVLGGAIGGVIMSFHQAWKFEQFLIYGQINDITTSMSILNNLNDNDSVSARNTLNLFLTNKFDLIIPLLSKNKDISELKSQSLEINRLYDKFMKKAKNSN